MALSFTPLFSESSSMFVFGKYLLRLNVPDNKSSVCSDKGYGIVDVISSSWSLDYSNWKNWDEGESKLGVWVLVPFLADYSTVLEGWNNHLHIWLSWKLLQTLMKICAVWNFDAFPQWVKISKKKKNTVFVYDPWHFLKFFKQSNSKGTQPHINIFNSVILYFWNTVPAPYLYPPSCFFKFPICSFSNTVEEI